MSVLDNRRKDLLKSQILPYIGKTSLYEEPPELMLKWHYALQQDLVWNELDRSERWNWDNNITGVDEDGKPCIISPAIRSGALDSFLSIPDLNFPLMKAPKESFSLTIHFHLK
jgi:hypothetical protein